MKLSKDSPFMCLSIFGGCGGRRIHEGGIWNLTQNLTLPFCHLGIWNTMTFLLKMLSIYH